MGTSQGGAEDRAVSQGQGQGQGGGCGTGALHSLTLGLWVPQGLVVAVPSSVPTGSYLCLHQGVPVQHQPQPPGIR